jgi:hypothetical protein
VCKNIKPGNLKNQDSGFSRFIKKFLSFFPSQTAGEVKERTPGERIIS